VLLGAHRLARLDPQRPRDGQRGRSEQGHEQYNPAQNVDDRLDRAHVIQNGRQQPVERQGPRVTGSDSSTIGTTRADGASREVIGVMRPFLDVVAGDVDIWTPANLADGGYHNRTIIMCQPSRGWRRAGRLRRHKPKWTP
jgi:hypothetical protein